MIRRTSRSPSEVTPARYLLPSAMSLSRRAATRGSTMPIRVPLLIAISRLPSGTSSTRSPGLTWASSAERARFVRWAKPVLPVSSTKMLTGALEPGLRRDGLLAGLDEQHLEPVDVALGDAVGRVERERLLVVLAGGAELAQLPQRLREPVLGLGVGAELEQPLVGLGRLRPLGGGRLRDGLLHQLALEAGLARRASGLRRRSRGRSLRSRPFGPCCDAPGRGMPGAWQDTRRRRSRARVSSIPGPRRQTRRPSGAGRAAGRSGRSRRFQATTTTPRTASRIISHRKRGSRRRAGRAAVERVPQVEHQRQQRPGPTSRGRSTARTAPAVTAMTIA